MWNKIMFSVLFIIILQIKMNTVLLKFDKNLYNFKNWLYVYVHPFVKFRRIEISCVFPSYLLNCNRDSIIQYFHMYK
jgi:hypothetical protein